MGDWAALYQGLERLARGLLPRMPRADHSVDLVVHGEPVIALEDLISNLVELEVALSPAEANEAERLATGFGLAPFYLHLIRALPATGERGLRAVVFTVEHAVAAPDLLEDLAGAARREAKPVIVCCWDVLADARPLDALELLRDLLDVTTSLTLERRDGATIDPVAEVQRLAAVVEIMTAPSR